jgi:hypothetical protein
VIREIGPFYETLDNLAAVVVLKQPEKLFGPC